MTQRAASLLGILLGKFNPTTYTLLLCIAGLVALTVAAFRWDEVTGWAALGVSLLLLEVRITAARSPG